MEAALAVGLELIPPQGVLGGQLRGPGPGSEPAAAELLRRRRLRACRRTRLPTPAAASPGRWPPRRSARGAAPATRRSPTGWLVLQPPHPLPPERAPPRSGSALSRRRSALCRCGSGLGGRRSAAQGGPRHEHGRASCLRLGVEARLELSPARVVPLFVGVQQALAAGPLAGDEGAHGVPVELTPSLGRQHRARGAWRGPGPAVLRRRGRRPPGRARPRRRGRGPAGPGGTPAHGERRGP